MFVKVLLFLGVGFHTVFPAAAEDVFRYEMETCIQMALSNHPAIKAGKARESSARSLLGLRGSEYQPTLGLDLNVGHLAGELTSPFSAISEFTDEELLQRHRSGEYYQGNVNLEIPIFKEGTLLGSTSSAVREAEFNLSETVWSYHALRTEVALNVAEAYLDLFKSQKAVETYQEIVAFLEADFKLAQTKFRRSLISKSDLLMAEVRWEMAKRDVRNAQVALMRGQTQLALFMGIGKGKEIPLGGLPLLLVPSRNDVAARVKQNHQIRSLQFRVKKAWEQIASTQKEQFPTVFLMARYTVADDFNRPIHEQWMAWFQVRAPLLDFGRGTQKVAFARARASEEEWALRDSKKRLEEAMEENFLGMEALDHKIVLLEKQIEQATEELKLNRALFQQNLLSQTVVRDSEASLLKLKLAHTEVQSDRVLTVLRLWWADGYGGPTPNTAYEGVIPRRRP